MPPSPRPDEAALDDMSERPLSAAEIDAMPRVSRCKVVRWSLDLTQEEFAARYRIPLATVQAWETGATEPDSPARAYLEVIAAEPETTARALMGTLAA